MKAPATSLDPTALDALHAAWGTLAAAPSTERPDGWSHAVAALAGRFVAHRTRLFAESAELQANAAPDDPAMVARTDANQDAIKQCTIALGEMTAALGRSSLGG